MGEVGIGAGKVRFWELGREIPMRGFSWRAKASELYTLLMKILNWAVTVSLFNPYPVWKRPGSVAVSRSSGAVKQESGVSDEKRAFLEEFGGVYGYPGSSSPIDKLRATEFARLDGTWCSFLTLVEAYPSFALEFSS